ncbi:IspD/TarI family cytidylyltransferase [Brevibacterium casei]|uniref:IspD/TarI family cytidylyltransferase n=1 Tax=Brevibacterium casei TaxID=33889 RepID=UPI0021539E14|nr:2-C-methyl-D-erythritol 4-phosphate cytidylyltransferase [Brevibacterium casei]MDH5149837.1 2-C-methyl-D-erythritol 4-phosphate cytidylyltransferase [Brevibacterium casei]
MVPAAGSGTRLGHPEPKAFVSVDGRTLLAHSLEAIISSGVATTIVVAAPEEFLLLARAEIDEVRGRLDADDAADSAADVEIVAVVGGADRVESVDAGLRAAGEHDVVLVHDAARALTPPDVFRRVADAVSSGAEAVVPVLPMIDTVRRAEAVHGAPADADFEVLRGDLDRGSLRRVQTPQGFAAEILRRAHDAYREEVRTQGADAREATDDAGLVERLGVDVVAVAGDEESLKITYPLDLVLAEHIARTRGR